MATVKKIADSFREVIELITVDEQATLDIQAVYVNKEQDKIVVEIGYILDDEDDPVFLLDNIEEPNEDENEFERAYRGELL